MKNVLLVDDDSTFNFLNEKALQSLGFVNHIHTALNGRQAIGFLNDYFGGSRPLPDIILLDLNMPIMDGFGFLEAFRRLDFPGKDQITIVIVSSSYSPDDIKRAKDLGVSQYLTKPLETESLRKALMMN